MAVTTRKIGLSLGADLCWPASYEGILEKLDLMSHEVFLDPWSHTFEASILIAAFLTLVGAMLLAPKKPSEIGARQKRSEGVA